MAPQAHPDNQKRRRARAAESRQRATAARVQANSQTLEAQVWCAVQDNQTHLVNISEDLFGQLSTDMLWVCRRQQSDPASERREVLPSGRSSRRLELLCPRVVAQPLPKST